MRVLTREGDGIPPGVMVIENYLKADICKRITDYADQNVGKKVKVLDSIKSTADKTIQKESAGRITDYVAIDGMTADILPLLIEV